MFPVPVGHCRSDHVDEFAAVVRTHRRREQFLELIDDEQQREARRQRRRRAPGQHVATPGAFVVEALERANRHRIESRSTRRERIVAGRHPGDEPVDRISDPTLAQRWYQPGVHDAGLAAAGCSDDRNQVPLGAGLGESREHRLDQAVAAEEHVGVGLLERTQPDIGVAFDDGRIGRTVVPTGQRRDERLTERLHRIELLVGAPRRATFDHLAGAGAEVGRSDRRQPHRDAALVDRRRCSAQAAGESARSNRHLPAGTDTDRRGVELAVGEAVHVEVLDRGGDLADDRHERCGVDRCADEWVRVRRRERHEVGPRCVTPAVRDGDQVLMGDSPHALRLTFECAHVRRVASDRLIHHGQPHRFRRSGRGSSVGDGHRRGRDGLGQLVPLATVTGVTPPTAARSWSRIARSS